MKVEKMYKKIIVSMVASIFLISCSAQEKVVERPVIEVHTVEVKRPAPIVPRSDVLKTKEVKWTVLTKNNADIKMKEGVSYFALDPEQYKNLASNTNSLMVIIKQKNIIIKTYENYFR